MQGEAAAEFRDFGSCGGDGKQDWQFSGCAGMQFRFGADPGAPRPAGQVYREDA